MTLYMAQRRVGRCFTGGIYFTRLEAQTAWAEAAARKLRADNVDQDDLAVVETALTACVGGRRLYECWLECSEQMLDVEAKV